MFNNYNFNDVTSEVLEDLIRSAMDYFDTEDIFEQNSYYLISEDFEIIDASLDIDELSADDGFIVSVIYKEGDDIWEPFTRSFVNYFNEKCDGKFEYYEWYDPSLDENYSDDIIDDDTLIEFYDHVCKTVAGYSYLGTALNLVINKDTLEIIEVTSDKTPESPNNGNCIVLTIDPTKHTSYLYMSEDCKDEIKDKLGFEFERDMFFDFEISENYEDEEFDE
jgi:hypothetical protein